MSLNVAGILRESAKAYPDKPALIFDGGRITYAELDALTDQFARGLQAEGFAPGTRIGLQLPNIPQFVISYFGILKAGCVAVPMNVLLKAPEVELPARQLPRQRAHHLGRHGVGGCRGDRVPPRSSTSTWSTRPGVPEATVGVRFETLLAADPSSPAPLEQTDPGDTAVIIYTSGTTGTPKGAELTHFQLLMNCDTPGRVFGMRADDVSLVLLPLFHVFGLSSQLNVAIRFGATLSLVPRFDAAKVIEVIDRDRATLFVGVPTMFLALLHHPDVNPDDIASLRVGISGGASIPAEVLDAFEKRFGVVILEGYGLTETRVDDDVQHQRRGAQGLQRRQADLGGGRGDLGRRRPAPAGRARPRRRDRDARRERDAGLLRQPAGDR